MIVAAALAAAAAAAPARETVPFSFGWRHFLGTPGTNATCPPSTFPTPLNGFQCSGFAAVDTAADAAACASAACALGAEAWQFCTAPNATTCASTGARCWAGSFTKCDSGSGAPWVGGARAPPPPGPPPPAARGYDDAAWPVVDAPHDALIATPYSRAASNGQGSIPKSKMWYRKHFTLPADWAGSHVEAYFDGVFSVVTSYLNGVEISNHTCGYTSFAVRLDNVSGAVWGGENVLALFVDATITTGWWYEGGGLFRDVRLVRSALPARLGDDGVFAPAFTEGAIAARATPAEGMTAASATVVASAAAELFAAAAVSASFSLFAADGATLLASASAARASGAAGDTLALAPPPLVVANAELWSIARPYLHVLAVTLLDAAGAAVDAVNVTVGIRTVRWDAINGAFINEQNVKLRGFCNHASFAAVGMGVPARVNLLRLQQIRGMGGNAWRMVSRRVASGGPAWGAAWRERGRAGAHGALGVRERARANATPPPPHSRTTRARR